MSFLKKENTTNFTITDSNHIIILCKVNSIMSRFIIDTGASNSCINYLSKEKFNLNFKKSDEKAYSATDKITNIFYSKNNILEISHFKKNNFDVILFDMSNINNTLKEKEIQEVDGIIGGEILKEHKAFIDYEKKILTLKLYCFINIIIHQVFNRIF